MPRRPSPLIAPLLLLACTGPPVPLAPPGPPLRSPFPTMTPAEFPGAGALLLGFDDRTGATPWQSGDAVLFGLRLTKGDTVHRWLLRLTVLIGDGDRVSGKLGGADVRGAVQFGPRQWTYTAMIAGKRRELPVCSDLALVRVEVCDEAGARLGKSVVELPRDLMGHGLLRGIECALRHRQNGGDFRSFASEDDVRPMAEGLIALVALLHVVQHDKVLEDYFWLVVQRPSLWSVVQGLGVTASLTASPEQSVLTPLLPAGLPLAWPAYAMPMRVDVNDEPALLVDVLATDPARPYGLCAGIVAATARHPTDQGLRFDVQLLAARLAAE
jgi:hypothetical protein